MRTKRSAANAKDTASFIIVTDELMVRVRSNGQENREAPTKAKGKEPTVWNDRSVASIVVAVEHQTSSTMDDLDDLCLQRILSYLGVGQMLHLSVLNTNTRLVSRSDDLWMPFYRGQLSCRMLEHFT